jgi:hypothetical protein
MSSFIAAVDNWSLKLKNSIICNSTKRHLGINLPRCVQWYVWYPRAETHKLWWERYTNGKYSVSINWKPSMVKMSTRPMNQCNPNQNSSNLFCRYLQTKSKIMWKRKSPRKANRIKKYKVGEYIHLIPKLAIKL